MQVSKYLLTITFALLLCSTYCLNQLSSADLTLEFARTDEERMIGLMGRKSLPQDHGMLFCYNQPQNHIKVWMYNCYFDLSLAFLDSKGKILEIHDLKAYPEAMRLPDDLRKEFYHLMGVTSKYPASFILEVPKGWFHKNDVKVGDILETDYTEGLGHFIPNVFQK